MRSLLSSTLQRTGFREEEAQFFVTSVTFSRLFRWDTTSCLQSGSSPSRTFSLSSSHHSSEPYTFYLPSLGYRTSRLDLSKWQSVGGVSTTNFPDDFCDEPADPSSPRLSLI